MTSGNAEKVYQLIGPAWSRAFRCIWMMEELGLKYELLESLPASRTVKKFNPSGKVPILLEWEKPAYEGFLSGSDTAAPSFVLTESVAINNYLAASVGSNLVPSGLKERAKYDETVSFVMSEIDGQALWNYRKHIQLGKHFGHIPEMATTAQDHFDRMNKLVSKQLRDSEGDFLLGKSFSAADIVYAHCLTWGKMNGWDRAYGQDLSDYLNLCMDRRAYLKADNIRSANKGQKRKSNEPIEDRPSTNSKL